MNQKEISQYTKIILRNWRKNSISNSKTLRYLKTQFNNIIKKERELLNNILKYITKGKRNYNKILKPKNNKWQIQEKITQPMKTTK